MKHSKYTANDSAKLKTGPGSSAPLLCGVWKTSIVASRYYLVFPTLYLASRPLLPEGRAGIAWDHQSSKFLSLTLIDTVRLVTHYFCLHLLLFLLPSLCSLYSPSSSLSSIFVYTTKGQHLSAASAADCELYS